MGKKEKDGDEEYGMGKAKRAGRGNAGKEKGRAEREAR